MPKLTFNSKSKYVQRYKADVLADPDSWIPFELRKKLQYNQPFTWTSFLKHLSKPSVQKIIKEAIDIEPTKKLIKQYHNIYPETNPEIIRKAIRQYLQQQYRNLSVFDSDVKYFVLKWKLRWQALTDTSVRDGVWEIYKKLSGQKTLA